MCEDWHQRGTHADEQHRIYMSQGYTYCELCDHYWDTRHEHECPCCYSRECEEERESNYKIGYQLASPTTEYQVNESVTLLKDILFIYESTLMRDLHEKHHYDRAAAQGLIAGLIERLTATPIQGYSNERLAIGLEWLIKKALSDDYSNLHEIAGAFGLGGAFNSEEEIANAIMRTSPTQEAMVKVDEKLSADIKEAMSKAAETFSTNIQASTITVDLSDLRDVNLDEATSAMISASIDVEREGLSQSSEHHLRMFVVDDNGRDRIIHTIGRKGL